MHITSDMVMYEETGKEDVRSSTSHMKQSELEFWVVRMSFRITKCIVNELCVLTVWGYFIRAINHVLVHSHQRVLLDDVFTTTTE
jgi:hypothetical protein